MFEEEDEELLSLAYEWMLNVARAAVSSREVQIVGKSFDELRDALAEFFKSIIIDTHRPMGSKVDYQPSLLAEAERYEQAGNDQLAVVFYATYVEHWLNDMIQWAAANLGWRDPRDVEPVFIRPGLDTKMGPIWRLLFDEPLPASVTRPAKRLADSRNGFLHYKWPVESMSDPGPTPAVEPLAPVGRALIADLTFLEDQILFGGRVGEIEQALLELMGLDEAPEPLA